MRVPFNRRNSANVLTVAVAVAVAVFGLTALWLPPVSQAAEKSNLQSPLTRRSSSRAIDGISVCHHSGAVAPGGSALFAASSLALPQDKSPDDTSTTQPADAQPSSSPEVLDLSDEVVRDVLTHLQRGIETHDLDRVMEIFDQANMKDYAQFHDQMVAFFRRYDSIKFRYQLLQVTSDKDGGFAIADIDMDADPSDILPTPQRHSTQMRFQLKRASKGWRVIALRPPDFFNQ